MGSSPWLGCVASIQDVARYKTTRTQEHMIDERTVVTGSPDTANVPVTEWPRHSTQGRSTSTRRPAIPLDRAVPRQRLTSTLSSGPARQAPPWSPGRARRSPSGEGSARKRYDRGALPRLHESHGPERRKKRSYYMLIRKMVHTYSYGVLIFL